MKHAVLQAMSIMAVGLGSGLLLGYGFVGAMEGLWMPGLLIAAVVCLVLCVVLATWSAR